MSYDLDSDPSMRFTVHVLRGFDPDPVLWVAVEWGGRVFSCELETEEDAQLTKETLTYKI